MARFKAIYVRRSDGKAETIGKGKRREINQPTEDQLDQKPDKDGVSDFYREVGMDENKHLDWRRKLGGMLARELDWKEKSDHGYMLVNFPENYRLYEHIKKTEKDGKLEVKSKTHAAGGNDRQDAYLYGHPDGRRKRFRSPGDFFPHLLWLATDESGDPDNCTCKICSPEESDGVATTTKVKAEKAGKQAMDIKPFTTAPQNNAPALARQASQQGAQIKAEAAKTSQRSAAGTARHTTPSPLPPPRVRDQQTDSLYRAFLYRSGELVWFRRGQAWGLGVILRRWVIPSDRQHKYMVQPLSHPLNHPQSVIKTEPELRPWLAWSVPKFIAPGLNDLAEPLRFETADWSAISSGRFGAGDMEVDASILAAKMIDSSYTPIHLESSKEIQPGTTQYRYHGVFLGAEKIWVGDPVRLVIGNGTDIMVVHAMIERRKTTASSTPDDGAAQPSNLSFVGDIYTLTTVPHSDLSVPTPASLNNNPHLPMRLTEDLAFRNARSIPVRREANYWHLLSASATIDALSTVKGRWYEASTLLPLLQSENDFNASAAKGVIQEAGLWMNSRGDCVNSNRDGRWPKLPPENVRKGPREEAFGNAVPRGVSVVEGHDPPAAMQPPASTENVNRAEATAPTTNVASRMDIDPAFSAAQPQQGVGGRDGHLNAGTGIDEFMNLEEMDDQAGFDQTFNNPTSNAGGSYY